MNVMLSRRGLLKVGAAAGGGLLLNIWSPELALGAEASPAEFIPNCYLKITRDRTTFFLASTEMGQGVTTSLSLLICEELELDPAKLDIQFAPAMRVYDNPSVGAQITGGSSSVRTMFDPLRHAGATAREMLKAAAAEQWQVPHAELVAEDGRVRHGSSKSAAYGELAERASGVSVPNVELKIPGRFKLVGKYAGPRLDVFKKVDGTAVFAMDVTMPDLRVAVVVRPPVIGAQVKSYDEKAARAFPGVEDVIPLESGIAVVAKTTWHARQGAEKLAVQWDLGPNGTLTSDGVRDQFRALLTKGEGRTVKEEGTAVTAIAAAAKKLTAQYEAPYLAHAPMEPMNATAWVRPGKVEVWAGTQSQTFVKGIAARLADVSLDEVEVHTTYAGGGFGRRSMLDFIVEPVLLSKKTGKPIKVVWSREDDMRGWNYRPYSLHALEAGLDAEGRLVGVHHKVAVQSMLEVFAAFLHDILPDGMPGFMKSVTAGALGGVVGMIADPTSSEGAHNTNYEIPNHQVELFTAHVPVPIAPWRSVGHSFNAFVMESFIDELAHAAGKDPLEFRQSLLKVHHRSRLPMELVAKEAGWGKPLPPGHFHGIAAHGSFESYAAAVAEVSIEDNQIRVHRIVTAIDCGRVVHPDNIKAQLESAAIYGLSAALKQKLTLANGAIVESNFNDYEVIRMFEAPRIDAHLVINESDPGGVGEPGVPPIAPAVANAVFAATGQRLRRLPLRLGDTWPVV